MKIFTFFKGLSPIFYNKEIVGLQKFLSTKLNA